MTWGRANHSKWYSNLNREQVQAVKNIRQAHEPNRWKGGGRSRSGDSSWWLTTTPSILPAQEVVVSYFPLGGGRPHRWIVEVDGSWAKAA